MLSSKIWFQEGAANHRGNVTLAIPRFDSDYSRKLILGEFILDVARIYRRRCLESSGQRLSYVRLVHKKVSGSKIYTSNLLLIR